ncbi:MAG: hypothetical protein RLZZ458_3459 [Planctomycetota bacterium]|jgi:hypothetical protein
MSTASAAVGTAVAATVDNVITAGFQGFFSLAANTTVAVSQSTGQSSHNGWVAAALVGTCLVANLVCCFSTNTLVSVIQTVDESVHDFRIAAAVIVAQLVKRVAAVLCVAVRH